MTDQSSRRDQAPSVRRGRRQRARTHLAAILAFTGGLAIICGAVLTLVLGQSVDTGRDMRGNSVALDSDEPLPAATATNMKAIPDMGVRFVVPSVGLNVPLGALTMVDGTITPPGFTSAYLVRNLGVVLSDAAEGTVFVAMHSMRGGAVGPGNYLIDVDAQKAWVRVGAAITVGTLHYRVTGSQAIAKTSITTDASLWRNSPGRLVILTCLQVPAQTESVDNMVITAQLVATSTPQGARQRAVTETK